jgi:hypothetical protein
MSKPASNRGRYGLIIGLATVVAMLAGIITAMIIPATYTSTALVVPDRGQPMANQEAIAGSDAVLQGALAGSAMSLAEIRRDIKIGSPAWLVMSISATGKTALDAQETATAVANSYIKYVNNAGHTPAVVLQPAASNAVETSHMRWLTGALVGSVCGLIAGVMGAVAARRRI